MPMNPLANETCLRILDSESGTDFDPEPDPLARLHADGAAKAYHRGQEIYRPEDPAEYWYRILFGVARKCALLADGRRQIVDFLLPGDLFGFAARRKRHFGVEAAVDGTLVIRYPRRQVEILADSDNRVGRMIRNMAFEANARMQMRMLILGRMTAVEKVGCFLTEMADRSSEGPSAPILLQMSRYDIADYLALSIETVSRALSDLKRRGAITINRKRHVIIADRKALGGLVAVGT